MEKSGWFKIIENNYGINENDDIDALTDELLGYLDSPDAELRDTIAYSVFARWIITHVYYSVEQLSSLVERLIPKLNQSLGNHNDETVFGRSYAVSVLSLLAYQDDRSNFMSESQAHSLLDQARNYLIAERDHRAYVEGKGWANACSNTADLLKFMARNSVVRTEDARRIMDSVAEKVVMQTNHIFNHDEDERLAQVVMAILDLSLLTTLELEDWLKHFHNWKVTHDLNDDYNPTFHATYQNIKNFLRSLYIHMQMTGSIPIDAADFEPELLDVIREFSL